MYRLQVHQLTRQGAQESDPGRNVFLMISSEGQAPRKFLVGNTSRETKQQLRSLVHIISSPVTMRLYYGPRLFEQIGIHTLVDFLIPKAHVRETESISHQTKEIKDITFHTRGQTESYVLSYSVQPVLESFTFVLNSISCIRQFSVSFDRVYAEVEFNHSPHSITPSLASRYHLGNMKNHDSSSLRSTQNLIFNAVGNFVVTFYVKSKVSEHRLGSIVFVPDGELVSVALSKDTPHSDGGKLAGIWGIESILQSSETMSDKRVILTTNLGASYDIHFSIYKRNRKPKYHLETNVNTPSLLPPSLWDKVISTSSRVQQPFAIEGEFMVVDQQNLNAITYSNECEILIDGEMTFKRYFEAMMGAQHSISIIGWELSLSFGLVPTSQVPDVHRNQISLLNPKWVSLQDILLHKALSGCRVRILVWRHEWLSYLNRLLYLGEVTIEKEVEKFEVRCRGAGLNVRVFHTVGFIPDQNSPFACPIGEETHDAQIVIVIVGNPSGIISCHHEKIVLVDGECQKHSMCFLGGFDIARGRYDSTDHNPPPPIYAGLSFTGKKRSPNNDWNVQPLLKQIRFLWHDTQVMIKGPTCHQIRLHVEQRWSHAFSSNILETRKKTVRMKIDQALCEKKSVGYTYPYSGYSIPHCQVRFHRCWPGIIDGHMLLDAHVRMIHQARKYLYFEHQYPFQNFTLAQAMCEALVANPDLHVIIIAPLKTDLPSGIVGDLFDQSQDHINSDLSLIYETAPDRVGIYFLIKQEPVSKKLKPIYVHSKMCIVDDEYIEIGSANTDNLSYYRSSEVNVTIQNPRLARNTRIDLMKYYRQFNLQLFTKLSLYSWHSPLLDIHLVQ